MSRRNATWGIAVEEHEIAAEEAPARAKSRAAARQAVILVHGMGEQISRPKTE